LNSIDHKGLHVQAMALDWRTMLGPYVKIQSIDTLRRMLAYLGATAEQTGRLQSVVPPLGSWHCADHFTARSEEFAAAC
jgi:hypothetical protein